MLFTYVINKQMQIYKYIQSHDNVFHQHVSVSSVNIIIRVFYKKNTINKR